MPYLKLKIYMYAGGIKITYKTKFDYLTDIYTFAI